ncbi:protein of unknown function [Methylocaldum szegediense]|uniref:Uncharacterized protein n=1 Tax=Methylocaldum szegediense TaxID=73780 RepID=A0ABM9HYM0_9GAMM|nr:protein of unknown function [Methylocaldum szegediense]
MKRDLIKKGLRRRPDMLFTCAIRLKRDLIKKGLRRAPVMGHVPTTSFETRPD